jgi:hypothetical protein
MGEQRPREKDPLPLALVPGRERTRRQVLASDAVEELAGPVFVRLGELLDQGDRVARLPVRTTVSAERSGGISSARTWLAWLIRGCRAGPARRRRRGPLPAP